MLPQNIFVSKLYSILYLQLLTPTYPKKPKKTIKSEIYINISLNQTPNLDFPSPKTYILTQKRTFCHK